MKSIVISLFILFAMSTSVFAQERSVKDIPHYLVDACTDSIYKMNYHFVTQAVFESEKYREEDLKEAEKELDEFRKAILEGRKFEFKPNKRIEVMQKRVWNMNKKSVGWLLAVLLLGNQEASNKALTTCIQWGAVFNR